MAERLEDHTTITSSTKLANYTGLKKEDKRYLSLDKLSTLMEPALRGEEKIQRIFFDAGCSDLFEITQDLVADPAKIKSHVSTKVLLDYLMLNPVETEASTDFSDALNCCTLTEGFTR